MHDRRTRFSCLYAAGHCTRGSSPHMLSSPPRLPIPQLRKLASPIKSSRSRPQPAGKHLTLVTDLPPSREIDALIELFDLAFPEWCRLLAVDAEKHADWHVTAYLMKLRERFTAAGLLPKNLPEFKSGYSSGDSVWLYDQQSEYYRRHLLLHEGTHCFMSKMLGAVAYPGMPKEWPNCWPRTSGWLRPAHHGVLSQGTPLRSAQRGARRSCTTHSWLGGRLAWNKSWLTTIGRIWRMSPTAGVGRRRLFWMAIRAIASVFASCNRWLPDQTSPSNS